MNKTKEKKVEFLSQPMVWMSLVDGDMFKLRKLIALTYTDTHFCRMGDVAGIEWLRPSKESLFVSVFTSYKELYGRPQLRLPGYRNIMTFKNAIQPNGPYDAYYTLGFREDPEAKPVVAYSAYPALSSINNQVEKGKRDIPFLVAGLALSIKKNPPNKMKINKGGVYEVSLKRFLENNPQKTKKDFPYVIVNASHFSGLAQNSDYADLYEYNSDILEVEKLEYGPGISLLRLTIEPMRFIGAKSNFRMYLYVSNSVKENYKPKVGDSISGLLALYATKEYKHG